MNEKLNGQLNALCEIVVQNQNENTGCKKTTHKSLMINFRSVAKKLTNDFLFNDFQNPLF